jgi:carbon-monoxide dehydrogenase medium subunit
MSKLKDAKVMAGGTDLIVDLKMGRFKPKYVVYIGGLQELRYMQDDGTSLRIGALTTIQEILDSRIVDHENTSPKGRLLRNSRIGRLETRQR